MVAVASDWEFGTFDHHAGMSGATATYKWSNKTHQDFVFQLRVYSKLHCLVYPAFLSRVGETIKSVQMRVDEGETFRAEDLYFEALGDTQLYSVNWVDWGESNLETMRQQATKHGRFAKALMSGRVLRVQFEPIGVVERFSLRGSAAAIREAVRHCLDERANDEYHGE